MKIVEIQPRISYYIGGGEIVPTYQMLALSELGEDVYLITTTPKHQTEYLAMLKKKINVIELPIKALDFFKDKNEISFEDWNIESLKLQIIAAKKNKGTKCRHSCFSLSSGSYTRKLGKYGVASAWLHRK
jgi:hypothetical protein